MKIIRMVSRLTSMMRAMKIRMGSTTQVYIVESKNAGIAISLMPPYDGQEESIYLLSFYHLLTGMGIPCGGEKYALLCNRSPKKFDYVVPSNNYYPSKAVGHPKSNYEKILNYIA